MTVSCKGLMQRIKMKGCKSAELVSLFYMLKAMMPLFCALSLLRRNVTHSLKGLCMLSNTKEKKGAV